MDGDATAKNFEQGANSAMKETEMSSGMHESVKQTASLPTCSAPLIPRMLTACSPQQATRPPAQVEAYSRKTAPSAQCSMVRETSYLPAPDPYT